MATPEFQHYVPESYLKSWRTANDKGQQKVWVYMKGASPTFVGTGNVGGGEYYYRTRGQGGVTDTKSVEDCLSKLESQAGRVYKKIRNRSDLTNENRTTFAEYLVSLYRRGPYWKAKTPSMVKTMLPEALRPLEVAAHEDENEERRARRLAAISRVSEETVADPDVIFAATVCERSDSTDVIANMCWTFHTSDSAEFITSDSPFVYSTAQGIGDPKADFLHPIDRFTLLRASHAAQGEYYVATNDRFVEHCNDRTVRNAFELVFAGYDSKELDACVQKLLGSDLT